MTIRPKRAMTSFDVAAVVKELNDFTGSRIANIYGGENWFIMKLRGVKDARFLIIPGVRAHLTTLDITSKNMPTPLVMGLRKYIRNAVLKEAAQLGFDRIIVLKLYSKGEEYKLYIELLPRGILALTDENNTIIHLSETLRMKDRTLKRGAKYVPPPPTSTPPDKLKVNKICECITHGSIANLVKCLGYPGEVVEEALARMEKQVEELPKIHEKESVCNTLLEILHAILNESDGRHGYILYKGNEALSVVPFNPRGLVRLYGLQAREVVGFSDALDTFFSARGLVSYEEGDILKAEKNRLLASLQRAQEELAKLKKKAEELRETISVFGENIGTIYDAYNCAKRIRDVSGWSRVTEKCEHVVKVRESEGKIYVKLNERIIEVDLRLGPDKQLVELTRRLGEIEAKIKRGENALKDVENKLKSIEEKIVRRMIKAKVSVRRREWFEKYHWLITRNGLLAIGGRDAAQNESLVKKYLTPNRIFMHAEVHGAPAVIIFTEGNEPKEEDLKDAALLAAAYSKAWKSGMGAVDVYWVWGDQVSKSPPSGEYLGKGAFMVYGKRNYIRNIELKIALGIDYSEDKGLQIIVGPPEIVKERSIVYAILAPGDEEPASLAKKLKKTFTKKFDNNIQILLDSLSIDELRSRIPGSSRIIKIDKGAKTAPLLT